MVIQINFLDLLPYHRSRVYSKPFLGDVIWRVTVPVSFWTTTTQFHYCAVAINLIDGGDIHEERTLRDFITISGWNWGKRNLCLVSSPRNKNTLVYKR